MAWGSISLLAGFLEKENSLETLIQIFENVSPKGFLLTEYEGLRNFYLTASSRYLRTAALKMYILTSYTPVTGAKTSLSNRLLLLTDAALIFVTF